MKVLYLDTSSSFLYAGIIIDNVLVDNICKELKQDMSINTLPEVINMLTKNKVNAQEIDKLMVVIGPGSFTGVRIGVSIAKTWAWSLKKEIIPISSLKAMALSYKDYEYYIPVIDARRGYVYSAIYDRDYKEVLSPRHILLDELKIEIKSLKNYIFISNDENLNIMINKYNPDIENIVNHFQKEKGINPHLVNPEYLKSTEAEEKYNDKNN